jgi:ABC-type branched-subunit amino acid transport system substrate-binding protein
MRKAIMTALTAASIATFAHTAQAQGSKEPLRLPFPYIFSGPLIEFGERVWNEGVLPAVEVVNKNGGIKGRPLSFYKVDVRFPETASWLAEFRRLCANQDIPVMFGIGPTKSVLAIYEDTARCKIPVFTPSSTGAWPEKDYAGWIFRYQPTAEDVWPVLFTEAKQRLNLKRIAISYTLDDDYATSNLKIAHKVLKDLGIEIALEQSFRTKETNFASQVAAVRGARPDGILLLHQPGDAGTFLAQLRERGLDHQAYMDANIGGADFWRLSNKLARGTIGYSAYAANDPRQMVQDWVRLWRERTGRQSDAPDGFVTVYFDAVIVLAHVLNTATDLSREAIRDSFAKVKNLETITGNITWEAPGEVSRPQPILVEVGDDGILKKWP